MERRTLGRSVGWDGDSSLEGEERRKVDDLASSALDHMSSSSLAEGPTGREVCLDDLAQKRLTSSKVHIEGYTHIVPILIGEVHCRRTSLDPSAVDQDVDLASHHFKSFAEDLSGCLRVG